MEWIKSQRCESSSCVEAKIEQDQVFLRNSTNPDGPILNFTGDQWRDFVLDLKSGDFPDHPGCDSHP